jgi:hypothetical protein
VIAAVLYRRGSLRGGLLLAGALAYFLYVYASRSLGNAYNGLFLFSIALFSASLFAFLLTVASVDRRAVQARLSDRRSGLVGFLFASGVVTAVVWLQPLLGALARSDESKYLDTYTTTVTDVLDLGVIVPTLVVAAALTLRREALGYVLAVVMLVLLLLVAATIIVGTVFQVASDVSFTAGEIVGPIAGFLVLGAIGFVLLARLLRDAGEEVAAGRPRD